MNTNERTEGVQIELYERRELPPPARDQVDDVYAELVALVERGEIEAVNRQQWAKRMPIADCDATLRDTYLAFSDWATDALHRVAVFGCELTRNEGCSLEMWCVVNQQLGEK